MKIFDPSGCLFRWRLRLVEYDLKVIPKEDAQNTQGDGLSHLPTNAEALGTEYDDIPFFMALEDEPENPVWILEECPEK